MNRSEIIPELCKGCGACINACPRRCLALDTNINELGFCPARFMEGAQCSACGLCFYVCPEPGAVVVHKDRKDPKSRKDRKKGAPRE